MCYTQHDVQEQELSLIREYESRLIARETIEQTAQLTATTAYSESLSHISTLLRRTLRLLNGEPDPDMPTSSLPDSAKEMIGIAPHTSIFDSPYGGEWDAVAAADWALERESELSRLEKENELLRRLAGIPTGLSGEPLQKIDMGSAQVQRVELNSTDLEQRGGQFVGRCLASPRLWLATVYAT